MALSHEQLPQSICLWVRMRHNILMLINEWKVYKRWWVSPWLSIKMRSIINDILIECNRPQLHLSVWTRLEFYNKGLRRPINAKLKQAASVKLLVEVCMVVVWHTVSKWKETTITCISYYMCLNVTDKESEWLILAFSLCKILRAYYNYNSSYCTLCTFD